MRSVFHIVLSFHKKSILSGANVLHDFPSMILCGYMQKEDIKRRRYKVHYHDKRCRWQPDKLQTRSRLFHVLCSNQKYCNSVLYRDSLMKFFPFFFLRHALFLAEVMRTLFRFLQRTTALTLPFPLISFCVVIRIKIFQS